MCKSTIDSYEGWTKKKKIGPLKNNTHRVLSIRTFIYEFPNIKSYCLTYLPIASKIKVIESTSNWSKISLGDEINVLEGFILNIDIVKINHKVDDWVKTAESFINIPYRWGGRNSIGIDCSALIQLSLETIGFMAPRDTHLQINMSSNINNDLMKLCRGVIIFWSGHVGVMVDEKNILHSNAYHMKVIIEPLKVVKERQMKEIGDIIKVLIINHDS